MHLNPDGSVISYPSVSRIFTHNRRKIFGWGRHDTLSERNVSDSPLL